MFDPLLSGQSNLFPHASHPTVDTSEAIGPHSITTTGGCSIQGPCKWHLPKGACWPDLSDIGLPAN